MRWPCLRCWGRGTITRRTVPVLLEEIPLSRQAELMVNGGTLWRTETVPCGCR